VAEPTAEARIRDHERRLDMDPGSRLFVALAEDYRKIGRLKDALSALQKGLLAHPGYVAAQVALGRVYLEAKQSTDAIATFTKVLVADPGNLVAAKSLAEVQLARGEHLEALKKFKLYRALSGDRKVDEIIARLEPQVAPKPITPLKAVIPVEIPPPPQFQETDKGRRRKTATGATSAGPDADPFEMTSVPFELGDDSTGRSRREDPFPLIPTRDVVIASTHAAEPAPSDAATRVIRIPDGPAAEDTRDVPVGASDADVLPAAPPPAEPEPGKPTGRALADLYYVQGHYAEALQIYDDLVNRHPFDDDLKRRRRDAEARLLPADSTPSGAATDTGLERRLARVRALKHWLSRVQAG
jgi:tetratricopeptide (TPR) repeat protein